VLTRYFNRGEQMGFDQMIGLPRQNGTDVAQEETLVVDISSEQFFKLHVDFPVNSSEPEAQAFRRRRFLRFQFYLRMQKT
jgi:hypothetical protein